MCSKFRYTRCYSIKWFFNLKTLVKFAGGDELELLIYPSGIVPVISFLKGHHPAQFTNFIFCCGVDVPTRKNRFEVVYALLSLRYNARVRVRTYTDEVSIEFFTIKNTVSFQINPLDSISHIFSGAEWYEREVALVNFVTNLRKIYIALRFTTCTASGSTTIPT